MPTPVSMPTPGSVQGRPAGVRCLVRAHRQFPFSVAYDRHDRGKETEHEGQDRTDLEGENVGHDGADHRQDQAATSTQEEL